MKLIYVSHWRIPSEKTMSPLIMKTCEMFAREGIGVELWLPWRNNRMRKENPFHYHDIVENFKIRRLPALDLTGLLPFGFVFHLLVFTFNFSVFIYSFFIQKPKREDLIFYFHDVRDLVMLSLRWPKMFLEIHDFYKSSLNRMNRFCFNRVQGFVVTNKIKTKIIHDDFGVSYDRMLHQPNAVDVAKFNSDLSKKEARKRLGLPIDKKIILYTGHLFDWKGVDTLFEAHKFFTEDQIIYFVGGTDDDINKFKKRVHNSGVSNIVIVGRRPHKDMPVWLRAADVLVLPNTAKDPVSRYETSPVKLFEYMASGSPIVASDLPSIRNVVNEEMVRFFAPDSSKSLAEAILRIFKDEDGFTEKSSRRNLIEIRKYSWEERTKNIINFLNHRIVL